MHISCAGLLGGGITDCMECYGMGVSDPERDRCRNLWVPASALSLSLGIMLHEGVALTELCLFSVPTQYLSLYTHGLPAHDRQSYRLDASDGEV